jgi:hypothetical protein
MVSQYPSHTLLQSNPIPWFNEQASVGHWKVYALTYHIHCDQNTDASPPLEVLQDLLAQTSFRRSIVMIGRNASL